MTIRLAIAGVGNCASSLVQGLEYYRDADPTESVPGLMHVELGGYHVRDIEVVAAFDVDAARSASTSARRSSPATTTPSASPTSPTSACTVLRGPTLDGFGKYYRQVVRGVAGRARRRRPGPARRPGRRAGLVPAGRLRGGPEALRPGLPRRRRGLRQRHPGVHRLRPRVGGQVRGRRRARSSATTSRARSAPPSSTASWPASSRTAAWRSTARTSSTSAGTWTS